MSIQVRYFASLGESLGCFKQQIPAKNIATAKDVWNRANSQRKFPDNILVAINMDYADADSIVVDGDEVAFFPQVTGG